MSQSVIAYIVREGEKSFLMVLDDAKSGVHRFPIDDRACARLCAETARVVNSAMGGFNIPLANGK